MELREILKRVDHTLLRPDARLPEIETLCREALEWQTASVCIPPNAVEHMRSLFPELVIGTVAGFPLGYDSTAAKVAEVQQARAAGADEIDMVIDIGAALAHDYARVAADIRAVREASMGLVLKVIVETCYLEPDEKVALCAIVTDLEADYIKTSTGFGPAGADVADVRLFREQVGPNVRVKAAGGIRTLADFTAMIAAGAERIGASSAVALARSLTAEGDH